MTRYALRSLAAASLLSATLSLTGCPAPSADTTHTVTAGGTALTATDPFAGIAQGAATLKEAAGMTRDANGAGLTTVAPLTQQAALTQQSAYRIGALATYDEDDGDFISHVTVTDPEKITVNPDESTCSVRTTTYTTVDDADEPIETGEDLREVCLSRRPGEYSVDVTNTRTVATSLSRDTGVYFTSGTQTLSATEDLRVFYDYQELTNGATSSLAIVTDNHYDEDPVDTDLVDKISHRGVLNTRVTVIQGTLPNGQSIDLKQGWSKDGDDREHYFEGSVKLGKGQGKIDLFSDVTMSYQENTYGTLKNFPFEASGSITLTRRDDTDQPLADINITSLDCDELLHTMRTVGALRDAHGANIGQYEGVINKKKGTWLGTYQLTGQASKSIDLSAVLDHLF